MPISGAADMASTTNEHGYNNATVFASCAVTSARDDALSFDIAHRHILCLVAVFDDVDLRSVEAAR